MAAIPPPAVQLPPIVVNVTANPSQMTCPWCSLLQNLWSWPRRAWSGRRSELALQLRKFLRLIGVCCVLLSHAAPLAMTPLLSLWLEPPRCSYSFSTVRRGRAFSRSFAIAAYLRLSIRGCVTFRQLCQGYWYKTRHFSLYSPLPRPNPHQVAASKARGPSHHT